MRKVSVVWGFLPSVRLYEKVGMGSRIIKTRTPKQLNTYQ
jgi:hypothetical protein